MEVGEGGGVVIIIELEAAWSSQKPQEKNNGWWLETLQNMLHIKWHKNSLYMKNPT